MENLFDDFELDIQKVVTEDEPVITDKSVGFTVGIAIVGIGTGIITDLSSCSYGPAGCN